MTRTHLATVDVETVLNGALPSVFLLSVSFALMLAVWPLRTREASTRLRWLIPAWIVLLALPWFAPDEPIVLKAILVLWCAAGFVAKLYDFNLNAHRWREQTFLAWVAYVPNSLVLVDWRRRLEPARSRANAIAWTVRGGIEMIGGALLMQWGFTHDFGPGGFWLEHGVKTLAAYLLIFDGGFVLATGLCRLVGFNVMDFSHNPALASTPAAFWRRYNRDAGRILHDDIFVPYGGRRAPIRGIFVVFLVNGLLHEYLALVMTGHLRGFQVTFFLLHGAAVALTFRLRLRGIGAVIGWGMTAVFLYFTTMLFFATIDEIIPWYQPR